MANISYLVRELRETTKQLEAKEKEVNHFRDRMDFIRKEFFSALDSQLCLYCREHKDSARDGQCVEICSFCSLKLTTRNKLILRVQELQEQVSYWKILYEVSQQEKQDLQKHYKKH